MNTNQELYNFYLLNQTTNFVFECLPFDVSHKLLTEPAFINYIDFKKDGFKNVSQVATLDISASMINNMFLFNPIQVPFDVTDLETDSMEYGIVNTSYNFSFSKANTTTTTLPLDYIKAINREITNTDTIIFRNISTLIFDIEKLDSTFNLIIKQNISNNILANTSLHSAGKSDYAFACKQLIAGILTYSNDTRINQFWNDITTQIPPYSVVFHPGDGIVVRLGYVPKNGDGHILDGLVNTANNRLYTRTYKVLLNVT